MKVFLVADSVVIRERLKRMFTSAQGVQVIGEAGDAQRLTTDTILEQKPDVVFLDIQLLNGGGIVMLQRLKKTKPAPAVIILTGNQFSQYRQKRIEAGADSFFIKSTEFDLIIPALRELAKQARNSVTPTNQHALNG